MFYQYESGSYEGKYFLYIHKNLTKKKFIKKADVGKNSFAEQLFERIYDFITSELIDLKREYEKYYSREYDNFKMFLDKKFNIPKSMIEKFQDYEKKHPNLILYRKDWATYGNYNIGTFILSNEMKDRIDNILIVEE